jgi:aryl-alcohol dehydrogenase-like predicted oxidoreductase
VLSGASDNNQLKSNMKAFKFKLSEEEINILKTICVLPQTYWEERSKLQWN